MDAHYENLPKTLAREGVTSQIAWLYELHAQVGQEQVRLVVVEDIASLLAGKLDDHGFVSAVPSVVSVGSGDMVIRADSIGKDE